MVVRFLISNAYGVGGTIRTTLMTAGELARRHDVEVASVIRRRPAPQMPLDPRVRLRGLADLRPRRQTRLRAWAAARPSRLMHPDDVRYRHYSLLTDAAVLRYLKSMRGGVLIGTRPALNLAIARHAPASVVRIGQDHMNLEASWYTPALIEAMAAEYGRLDAVTALTEDTAARYRELIGGGARVERVPNAAPPDSGVRSPLDTPVVMAAGQLSRRKGFDRLLDAWAHLAPRHPGWRLEVFGSGPHEDRLRDQARRLGVGASVRFRGHSPDLISELARASIFAMTSRQEGFPMVLLEAMSVGLPVVAYDCPTGPRDIVSDGVDGYVVPDGRTRLLVEALDALMADEARRRALGAAAVHKVADFRIDAIGARWEQLFEELRRGRRR
jgi:glycosyltransferase involved in cell wall biosynthesis